MTSAITSACVSRVQVAVIDQFDSGGVQIVS